MIFLDDPVGSIQAHELLKAENFSLLKSERWDEGKDRRDSRKHRRHSTHHYWQCK